MDEPIEVPDEESREEIKRKAIDDAKDPRGKQVLIGLIALLVLLFGVTAWAISQNEQDDSEQDKKIQILGDAAKTLSDQIKEDGEKPEIDVRKLPDVNKPIQDPQGDIRDLVASLLVDFNQTGKFDGKDGVSPPAAKDGKQGEAGATPSNEILVGLVQQALLDFCSNGECTPDDGTNGDDGRGIVSGPTCQDDGTWKTTFDKEPFEETQPGPCKVGVIPIVPIVPAP